MSLPLAAAADEVPAETVEYTDAEVIAAYENDKVTVFAYQISGAVSAAIVSLGGTSCVSNVPGACYLVTKNASGEFRVFELQPVSGYGNYYLGDFVHNIDGEYGIPVITAVGHSGYWHEQGSFANLATGEVEIIGSMTMEEGKWQKATVGVAGDVLSLDARLNGQREFEGMFVQDWDITITAPDGSQRRWIEVVNTMITEPLGVMYEQTVSRLNDGLALEVVGHAVLYDPVNGLRTE